MAAAARAVAERGASASVEDRARRAGVGSATLHRHFPSRSVLLEAVFADQIRALCDRAGVLEREHEPGEALRTWILELAEYSASTRGLADALIPTSQVVDGASGASCEAMLLDTATRLLDAAADAHTVRPGTSPFDPFTLVNGISLSTGHLPEPAQVAARLTNLALDGVSRPHFPS